MNHVFRGTVFDLDDPVDIQRFIQNTNQSAHLLKRYREERSNYPHLFKGGNLPDTLNNFIRELGTSRPTRDRFGHQPQMFRPGEGTRGYRQGPPFSRPSAGPTSRTMHQLTTSDPVELLAQMDLQTLEVPLAAAIHQLTSGTPKQISNCRMECGTPHAPYHCPKLPGLTEEQQAAVFKQLSSRREPRVHALHSEGTELDDSVPPDISDGQADTGGAPGAQSTPPFR